jgi:hypothetical protein
VKTKNIINKFLFVFLLTFTFSLSAVTAQNDTVYVMKNGKVAGKYNVYTEVDSVIFYQFEIQPGDTMYVMKNGNIAGKYHVKTEVDSVIFYQPTLQPDTTPVIKTINVQVTVPPGSDYSHAGTKVMSYSTLSDVDASGKSIAAHTKQSVSVAYVFDKDDKLVMAGFITDSIKVISPASTAIVLLYWAHGILFQNFSMTESYIKLVEKIPGANEWITEFEKIFNTDPMTLTTGSYTNALKSTIEKMTARNTVDVYKLKAADITVDASDIKSGLQVAADDGLEKFSVNNYYRRRAHGFLYKMNYKDLDGKKHSVKESIEKTTGADKNFAVDPESAKTSVLGEVGKWIEGPEKTLESYVVKSGPVSITLGSNESEANYKVRIVGPGMPGNFLTNAENDKLERLEIETFVLDCLIPALSIAMSTPTSNKIETGNSSTKEKIIDITLTMVKTVPDVYEEIKKGNYKKALEKLIENINKDVIGKEMEKLAVLVFEMNGFAKSDFYAQKIKNFTVILGIFDSVLGVADILQISSDVRASKTIDEWNIIARSSQVKLLPKESTPLTLTNQKITAEIKNLAETGDTHPFFVWSTSGKYGTISDTKGHKGTSFESADNVVTYRSTKAAKELSAGDNIEYIYVKAFMGNTFVGTDTAIVNVKRYKYEMKPEGLTLTGKAGGAKEAALYLEVATGGIAIQPNNDVDFKVVWSTAGKHGGLYGRENVNAVTNLTTYDDNQVWYECTDKDTKEGTETIKARIYVKQKGESDYRLFDEVSGTVKILNDPKKIIVHVPLSFIHEDRYTESGGFQCYKGNVATFTEVDDAASYSVRFIVNKSIAVIGAPSTLFWKAGDKSPNGPPDWAKPGYEDGKYTLVYSWSAANGPGPEVKHSGGEARPGMAEVTITLK